MSILFGGEFYSRNVLLLNGDIYLFLVCCILSPTLFIIEKDFVPLILIKTLVG